MADAALPAAPPRRRGRLERYAGLPLACAVLGLFWGVVGVLFFEPPLDRGNRLGFVLLRTAATFSAFGAILSVPFAIACLLARRPRLALWSVAALLVAFLGALVATSLSVRPG